MASGWSNWLAELQRRLMGSQARKLKACVDNEISEEVRDKSKLRKLLRVGHLTFAFGEGESLKATSLGLSLLRNRGLAAKDILLDLAGGCFRRLILSDLKKKRPVEPKFSNCQRQSPLQLTKENLHEKKSFFTVRSL